MAEGSAEKKFVVVEFAEEEPPGVAVVHHACLKRTLFCPGRNQFIALPVKCGEGWGQATSAICPRLWCAVEPLADLCDI